MKQLSATVNVLLPAMQEWINAGKHLQVHLKQTQVGMQNEWAQWHLMIKI